LARTARRYESRVHAFWLLAVFAIVLSVLGIFRLGP
jgi:hypothetical protein